MDLVHFFHSHLAGFSFGEGALVFDKLKIGTPLTLKAEPTNCYDAHAIALYFEDKKIGYIPRSENKELSLFLQAGYEKLFEVRINRISPEEDPENQIGIVVFIKKKK